MSLCTAALGTVVGTQLTVKQCVGLRESDTLMWTSRFPAAADMASTVKLDPSSAGLWCCRPARSHKSRVNPSSGRSREQCWQSSDDRAPEATKPRRISSSVTLVTPGPDIASVNVPSLNSDIAAGLSGGNIKNLPPGKTVSSPVFILLVVGAIPGRPVARAEGALGISVQTKNQSTCCKVVVAVFELVVVWTCYCLLLAVDFCVESYSCGETSQRVESVFAVSDSYHVRAPVAGLVGLPLSLPWVKGGATQIGKLQ